MLSQLLVQRDDPDEASSDPAERRSDGAYVQFKALAAKYDGVRKDGAFFPWK